MKIGILGDTHGFTKPAVEAVNKMSKHGVNHIIQLGDFGIWTQKYTGVLFLDELNTVLAKKNIFLHFLAGNHENHDHLEAIPATTIQTKTGGWFVRSHIIWSPHGNSWTWDDKRFLTVGGAVSIDKAGRLLDEHHGKGKSWWAQEQLSDEALNRIVNEAVGWRAVGKSYDYLFTHDAPSCLPLTWLKPDVDSMAHRQKMDRLGKAVEPVFWFHGHYHTRVEYDFPEYNPSTKVFGLNTHAFDSGFHKGDGKDRWGILNTEDNTFKYATEVANEVRLRERIYG